MYLETNICVSGGWIPSWKLDPLFEAGSPPCKSDNAIMDMPQIKIMK
jgi:hypothetical protein